MKSLHQKLSVIAPFIFFPMMIILRKRKKIAYILICFLITTLSSCFLNFYRTNTKPSIDATTVSSLNAEQKYFVIHFLNSTNGLEDVHISKDTLYGKLVPIPPEHSKYLYPDTANPKNRIKAKDKKNALMEVHLYANAELNSNDPVFAANLSSFNRADIYELNHKATSTNHIISIVGIVLTAVAIVGIIGAIAVAETTAAVNSTAAACNCPQVYMDNTFVSGLYSGAVYSTLERTDYLPLNTVPFNAEDISFKIANAKSEEQFINKVQLLQVNHAAGVNILIDRNGNIFSYQKATAPSLALANDKGDIKEILKQTDELYYSFDNDANEDGLSDIRLTFDKPENAANAKLIIHARNTYWAGLIHKEFTSLFGDDFEKWRAKQEKADPKDLERWQTEQALPLMVYLKTNSGWKFIDYYPLIGNTASRDMIMNIDTKNVSGNAIEIKLETAYRFWDLDFAGIDYSNDEDFTRTVIEPIQALKSDSINETASLQRSDKEYVHLTKDEFISFKYAIPQPTDNNQSSYFLISGGYYHNLEKNTGKADYNTLAGFKKQGAFDKFSRKKYKEAQDVAAIINNLNKN